MSRERDWVHPSAEVRNRRGRVDKIVEDLGHRPPTVEAWFGSLCYPDLSFEESGVVARLASLIAQEKGLRLIEKEAFIVTASGHLAAPDPTSLFFGDGSEEADGIALVHPSLEADPEVRASLESLGISSHDANCRLDALLATAEGVAPETGGEFWRLSRLCRFRCRCARREPWCRQRYPRLPAWMACGLGFRTCCYPAWSFLRGGG